MKKVYQVDKDNYEDAGQASRDIKMTLKTLCICNYTCFAISCQLVLQLIKKYFCLLLNLWLQNKFFYAILSAIGGENLEKRNYIHRKTGW